MGTNLVSFGIFVPGVEAALPSKLDIGLRLKKCDLCCGLVGVAVTRREAKGLDDEFAEVVVVRWAYFFFLPGVEEGVGVEG